MPIFTEQDGSALVDAYRVNKETMKVCEYDYFSTVATAYYFNLIQENKEKFLAELMNQAKMVSTKNVIRIPIETVQTLNQYYTKPTIGRVFTSPSGLHSRCLYDIYRNSDFRYRMNYAMSSSDKFFVTLDFTLEDNGDEMRHTCKLWLNYRLAGKA